MMADEVGIPDRFVELAYYNALQEAHPTLIAMPCCTEYEWKPDGSLWWKDALPPLEDAESTLMMAHFFILKALESVAEYFKVKPRGSPKTGHT